MKYWIGIVLLWLTAPVYAADGQKVVLPDGRVAVVAQGDLEAASIGSYSIAVYADAALSDFQGGAVFSRDGSLRNDDGSLRLQLDDLNHDGQAELIITKLTAGSGHYLEMDVVALGGNTVTLLARGHGTQRQAIITALKRQLSSHRISTTDVAE